MRISGARLTVLLVAALLAIPVHGAAQAVGAGPLTGTLVETEPQTGVISLGRIKLAPGFTIDELGWDSNVFDEHDEPNGDYTFRGRPDLALFSSTRIAQVSAYAASDFIYFRSYERERAVGYQYRGRLDLQLSRFHPFLGFGQTRTRTRPNGEIDVRADQRQEELSSGISFDLGPNQHVFAAFSRMRDGFENGIEDGVDLPTNLNRDGLSYSLGVRTDVTPISTLTLSAALRRDEFDIATQRNMDNRQITAALRLGAEALISGQLTLTYNDSKPVDPRIKRFRGVFAQGALTYPIQDIGRFNVAFNRGLQYSFDETEALYLENSISLYYTHRLFGEVDAQVRASRSLFHYSYVEDSPVHTDTLDAAGASLGYNLRNRTRIAINYEVARRKSPAILLRNYDRVRIYLSWLFAF